nr:MAG TPA_asm: hypothetical protein [Caudoviricetes sp.]
MKNIGEYLYFLSSGGCCGVQRRRRWGLSYG